MHLWRWIRYMLTNKHVVCTMCRASLADTRLELRREGVCHRCEDEWMSRRAW